MFEFTLKDVLLILRTLPHSYKCFRETCTGGDITDTCWDRDAFGSSDDDFGECPASKILCMEGAYAPLCGSCMAGEWKGMFLFLAKQ